MFLRKFFGGFSGQSIFEIKNLEKFLSSYVYVKTLTPYMAPPNPEAFDLNKLESILAKDASTLVKAYLINWIFKRRFSKSFLYIYIYQNLTTTNRGPTLPLGIVI